MLHSVILLSGHANVGKNTYADELKKELREYFPKQFALERSLAKPAKEITAKLLNIEVSKLEEKPYRYKPLDNFNGLSPIDIVRNIAEGVAFYDKDFWSCLLVREIEQ